MNQLVYYFYVCCLPGLLKGSTSQGPDGGPRSSPAERPKTLRRLKNVYDTTPGTTGRKLSLRGRLLHVPGAQEVGRVRDLALTRASVYPFLVPSMNKRNGPKYQRLWRPSALGLSENLYS